MLPFDDTNPPTAVIWLIEHVDINWLGGDVSKNQHFFILISIWLYVHIYTMLIVEKILWLSFGQPCLHIWFRRIFWLSNESIKKYYGSFLTWYIAHTCALKWLNTYAHAGTSMLVTSLMEMDFVQILDRTHSVVKS